MYIAKINFELWVSKNQNRARNGGSFRGFVLGTQLWHHVANKKKELEVWDFKYADIYTHIIGSVSFMYITEI